MVSALFWRANAAVIASSLIFLFLTYLIGQYPDTSSFISVQALTVWTIIGAFLSVYSLTMPWVSPQRFLK
ncbi:MAG: hypothetical protein P4L50_06120 [Anaerolineaceae bacterium]|nr:hypothetical protein [Anaerolineaceae bacterium]